jgi:hypothetical protein
MIAYEVTRYVLVRQARGDKIRLAEIHKGQARFQGVCISSESVRGSQSGSWGDASDTDGRPQAEVSGRE